MGFLKTAHTLLESTRHERSKTPLTFQNGHELAPAYKYTTTTASNNRLAPSLRESESTAMCTGPHQMKSNKKSVQFLKDVRASEQPSEANLKYWSNAGRCAKSRSKCQPEKVSLDILPEGEVPSANL